MKYPLSFVLLTAFLLAGCQTSGTVSSAASDGDGVTCNEIHQAFNAYQRDRQSIRALQQLSKLVSPSAGAIAAEGISSAEQYYPQARASANIALTIRGCQPIL